MRTKISPYVSSKSCRPRAFVFILAVSAHAGAAPDSPLEPALAAPAPAQQAAVEPLAEPAEQSSAAADDIVEVIEVPSSAPTFTSPPPSPERFELHGWARQSIELGLGSRVYQEEDPRPGDLPYDRLISRSQLFARARYSRGDSFEVNLSGILGYSWLQEGPNHPSIRFNGFNGQRTEGVLEPALHELFVAFFFESVDLRIGQQRLAWGRADFFSPNDVVNPRDNRDPFLAEPELRTVPTPLLRADMDLPFGSLQAVFSPLYVPDRGDIAGSNWAGVQPDAPLVLRELIATGLAPSALTVELPEQNLTAPQAGARFAWSHSGWDFAHYYHYGFDGPSVELDPLVASRLSSPDLRNVSTEELPVLVDAIDSGNAPFSLRFRRRHHVGLDLGTTVGPFALRLEGAYQSQRVFYRQDLLSFVSPSLLGVASVELQTGERDKGALVEWVYIRVLDRPDAALLSYARDTLGVAANVRWTLLSPVFAELRAVIGIEPRTLILEPIVSARFGGSTISAGGLWLGGDDGSLGHYFRRNRELFLRVRYSF